MAEDIFADVLKEGSDAFADLEKETPPESQPDKEPAVEEKAEENVPFHKHPRWIEKENELKELRARDEATAKEIAELRQMRTTPSDSTIPEWFRELYGDNQVAWSKYAEREQQREQEIEQRLLEKQDQKQQAAVAEQQRWNKWVDDEITKLAAEGAVFDRNKLIKTMLDYRPTDENNNFDFKAGLKIYQALETQPDPAKSQARKELADKTTVTSVRGEAPKKDYMTAKDLRHRQWATL